MTRVRVVFGGRNVGILSRKKGRPDYSFAYDPDWIDTGVELSPIHLPLSGDPFEFSIPYFRDLPGLRTGSGVCYRREGAGIRGLGRKYWRKAPQVDRLLEPRHRRGRRGSGLAWSWVEIGRHKV